ncbi:amino acid/polyamine transporter I [Xylariaceae sp. FL0594]|nr:amino acid/polyamine transporter I [Xylariaceae sp. FL0594]
MVRPIATSVFDPAPSADDARDGLGSDGEIMAHANAAPPHRPASRDGLLPHNKRKAPTLTRFNGLALILSLQVGSGIFSVTSLISQQVSSPAEGLAVFVTAGLLVWTGAASFVELGLLVPSNGGIQDYLRASWGDHAGHLFSWVWIGVVKPAGNAVISSIFADYLLKALLPASPEQQQQQQQQQTIIMPGTTKMVALGCVAVLAAINCLGATSGAKAANGFVLLKLTALGSIIVIGLTTYVLGHGDGVPTSPTGWFGAPQTEKPLEEGAGGWLGHFSTAVLTALFCYGGWESAGFIAGDMQRPEKDLPVVINGAMTLVIVGFFLMNASLYICLPFHMIRESRTAAVDFANRTIGSWGGLIFSVAVAISAMGAANANVFAIGKLSAVASRRAYLPPILANLHCCAARDEAGYLARVLPWPLRLPVLVLAKLTRRLRWEHSVPIFALLLNWALTSVFILVGNFTGLITLIEIIKSFCYMMSVLGLFKLRRLAEKTPHSTAYRTWTFNPIIFAFMSGLLVIRGIFATPLQTPVFLLVGTLGLAVLYRRRSGSGGGHEPPLLPPSPPV